MNRVVIALGGNALGNNPQEQIEKAYKTAKSLIPIIKDNYEIVITHGNGPQVGSINLAFEEGNKVNSKVCSMPFSECGAMSQGYIGYHLLNALSNELANNGINKNVVSIITRVEVDKNDTAFKNPTKPIGSFYTYEESLTKPFPIKEDAGRGYRRVIASPKPINIIEAPIIESLIKDNIVISVGGGGIPVIKTDYGYNGCDAVIDKDFASSKLGEMINADILLILTAVNNASINFRKDNQTDLTNISIQEAVHYNEMHEFSEGSMKPKIEAAIKFVQSGHNRKAIITSIDNAYLALKGQSGTIIQ